MTTMITMKEVKTIIWTSKQLINMFEKEVIKFDSYVQRRKCWDNERKSLLIRTVLNGFPRVPEIYATNDTESKVYQCLDGQQRLTTIIDFMNDEIVLDEIKPIVDQDGNEYELTGKKYSDLPEGLQDIIKTYGWRVAYYDDLTDDEVAELFYLVNNSKPLSAIEHTRSLNPKLLRVVQEIAKHDLFTATLTAKAFEKYAHEDLVVKAYIMLTSNAPCYDTKVVREVFENTIITDEQVKELTAIFDRILAAYKQILAEGSKENKKVAKRVITRTHLLSIIPITKKTLDENISLDAYIDWLLSFYNGKKSPTKYDQYNSKATSGSGHLESVRARLNVINKDFNSFMKYYVPKKVETAETVEENKEIEIKNDNIINDEKNTEVVEVTAENTVEENTVNKAVEEKVPESTSEDMIEDDIPDNIKAILNASEELESGEPYDDMAGITDEILGEVFPDLVAVE